ncbi:hypothetical protein C8Q76DRAFT_798703 [Earliella scabrosa]|nr:hypothetical protein C8Q76DRAFT_798703 [Earliella scabrosa]
MLGQKILDAFPPVEDAAGPHCLPEPAGGLTIRRIKSAGLRIVTESDALRTQSLRGLPSSLAPPSHRQSYLSVRTPDTSCTFGRPNPTMLSPKHPPSSVLSTPASSSPAAALRHARRLSRYSQAESALRSAVECSSTEVSPQELQIRVLEKATALLSEQAKDAQVCAAKLRACLAMKDMNLSPEEVKSLQRECWLEERRSSARQSQSAHTRDLVSKLCSPISEVPPPLVESPAGMSRHEANLARFMQLSPTRVTFPPHSLGGSTSPTARTAMYRRQTISQMRPMRLRASALELALRSPIQPHRRSRSLDGSLSRRNSDSTDATFVEENHTGSTSVSASLSNALQLKLPPSPRMDGPNGVAHILKLEPQPRPRDTLESEIGDVALPDYAVGLLEDLVASSLDFALPEFTPTELSPSPSVPWQPMSATTVASSLDPAPRKSCSLPDFKFNELPDLTFIEPSPLSPHSPALPFSSSPPPPPLLPSSRPSSPPPPPPQMDIISRLRSPPEDQPASAFPPVRLRPATSNAHLRTGFTQSLHAGRAAAGSLSKLTSPSLVTVPEAEMGVDCRPSSSMSGYRLGAGVEGASAGEGEGAGTGVAVVKRKFSISSFRRQGRRRFLSQGSVALEDADGGEDVSVVSGAGGGARKDPRPRVGSSGEHGILARFKRRFIGGVGQ